MARTKKEKTAKEMFEEGCGLIIMAFVKKEHEASDERDYKSAELMVEKNKEFFDLMRENFDQYFMEETK